ncbi:MAG: enoyl-CoA hydratase-related protein [Acidobacteriota bacterium]|jgi:enoyl-CoA hydratase
MATEGDSYENLTLEIDGAIATLTVNRPKALNALTAGATREIGAAIDALAADDAVRAVIITGAGDRAFVAGADIGVLNTYNAVQARDAAYLGQSTFDKIEQCPKPVIAAINGFALGGGCELALACHIRLAADTAKIGLPEINLGVIPGHGGTQRLARLVGKGKALELICTGDHVGAEEAWRIGLVNQVVTADELMETARELAGKLAAKPPIAMRYALEAVNQGLNATMNEGQAIEAHLFGLLFSTEDQSEGMSAFLEKRKAEWKGR